MRSLRSSVVAGSRGASLDGCLGAAPEGRLRAQILLGEHAREEAVLQVVLVVGGRVAEVDDLRLQARGARPRLQVGGPVALALVLQQPGPHLVGEVEARVVGRAALESIHHPQHLGVVAEAAVLPHEVVQGHLPPVTEGRVPEVVPQGEGLAEGLVEAQGASDAARDLADLQAVGQARAVVVPLLVEEHLRLVHEPAERRGVRDPIAIALVGGPHRIRGLDGASAPGVDREAGPGRQLGGLARLARDPIHPSSSAARLPAGVRAGRDRRRGGRGRHRGPGLGDSGVDSKGGRPRPSEGCGVGPHPTSGRKRATPSGNAFPCLGEPCGPAAPTRWAR